MSVGEFWRVLEDYGVLIFKWNETSIKKKDVLKVIGKEPLFGHPVLSKIPTFWFVFMKFPDEVKKMSEDKLLDLDNWMKEIKEKAERLEKGL